jgi:hypothetical protein
MKIIVIVTLTNEDVALDMFNETKMIIGMILPYANHVPIERMCCSSLVFILIVSFNELLLTRHRSMFDLTSNRHEPIDLS